MDPYRRESLKILAIFKEMVPKGEIGGPAEPGRAALMRDGANVQRRLQSMKRFSTYR